MIGTLIAIAAWTAIGLLVRHEHRAQRRSDGYGWKGPGW